MKTMIGTSKNFVWILAVQCALALVFLPSLVSADQTLKKFRPNYKAVLMADADTGRVLFAEQEHRKVYPASLVKLMSVLLTFEAIEAGKTNLDEIVVTSTKASKIGGTQVFLKEGEEFTVRELLKAMIVRSANDATLAILMMRPQPERSMASSAICVQWKTPLTLTSIVRCQSAKSNR